MTGSSPLYLDDLYNHNDMSTQVIRDPQATYYTACIPDKILSIVDGQNIYGEPCPSPYLFALLFTFLLNDTGTTHPKPHAQDFGTNNGVTQLNNINTPQDCCVACIINPTCDASVFSSSARICFQVA